MQAANSQWKGIKRLVTPPNIYSFAGFTLSLTFRYSEVTQAPVRWIGRKERKETKEGGGLLFLSIQGFFRQLSLLSAKLLRAGVGTRTPRTARGLSYSCL